MNTIENSWSHVILRACIISVTVILAGFIFYRFTIFIPRMWQFQFTVYSISAGIAYAFSKGSMRRHLLPALFVWYVILTGLIVKLTWRSLILNFLFLSVITLLIFVYNYVVTKPYSSKTILRIIFSGAITAIANGLITTLLGIFSFKFVLSHIFVWLSAIEQNLEMGAVIGLALGAGIEVAEYLNSKLNKFEISLLSEDEIVHKTS